MRSYFISACFELADGCSGNCLFCCLLDAKSLSAYFCYTPKNQLLWQEILHNTREVLGEIAGSSICYFGTEPFDNPDYEKFITDLGDSGCLSADDDSGFSEKMCLGLKNLLNFWEG